jgi:hypothetical protein
VRFPARRLAGGSLGPPKRVLSRAAGCSPRPSDDTAMAAGACPALRTKFGSAVCSAFSCANDTSKSGKQKTHRRSRGRSGAARLISRHYPAGVVLLTIWPGKKPPLPHHTDTGRPGTMAALPAPAPSSQRLHGDRTRVSSGSCPAVSECLFDHLTGECAARGNVKVAVASVPGRRLRRTSECEPLRVRFFDFFLDTKSPAGGSRSPRRVPRDGARDGR